MRKVPFFDYPKLYKSNQEKFLKIFDEVSSRGAYILQKDLVEFEESIARFCDVNHAIGVANATDALEIVFFLSGIEKGDEVIIFSPYWVSFPDFVSVTGATPIYVETNPDSQYEPIFKELESKITNNTKGIIINSPSNPTGGVWSDEAISRTIDIAKDEPT